MKQSTRNLPDVDLNGRRRREVKLPQPTSRRLTVFKLFGGPLSGATVELPSSTEKHRVGRFFTYSFGGRGMLVIQPVERHLRRFLHHYIGLTGKHPGVEAEYAKPKPVKNPDRVAHGRGRLRRIARQVDQKGAVENVSGVGQRMLESVVWLLKRPK